MNKPTADNIYDKWGNYIPSDIREQFQNDCYAVQDELEELESVIKEHAQNEVERYKKLCRFVYQSDTARWWMKYKINEAFPDLVHELIKDDQDEKTLNEADKLRNFHDGANDWRN